jgi:ATP-binding cassette subfamily B protein
LLYLASVLVHTLVIAGQRYLTGWVSQRVIYDLRDDVFRHLQKLSLRFYDNREMGDTISRVTNDIDTLNELLSNGIVNLANTVVGLVGVLLAMMAMNLRLSLFTFAIIPFVLISTAVFRAWIGQAYRIIREKLGQVTARVEEGVTGVRIIQSFAQEERSFQTYRAVNQEYRQANLDAAVVRSIYFPSVDIIGAIGTAFVLWFGGVAVLRGDLTFGIVVAFIFYLFRLFEPIRQLTMLYDQVLAGMAASDRIFELMDTLPEVVERPDAPDLPRLRGRVEFRDVSFHYVAADPVLRHVNIHADPGEMIALVGATGAGKTTTIGLLCRFYDVVDGAILVDDHKLTDIAIRSLRQQLGMVLQEGFLFQGTIRDNIRYGRLEATDEEVEAAAKAVGAHEFVMRMPQGYDTEVRERGEKLSMGERQLICLARALVADPRILILDEATSSIDPYTELVIQSALLKLFEGRTAIVIAHRLSTVRRASRIYVFKDGEVVEVGTHNALLAQGGIYANLYEMQFKAQEELAQVAEAAAGDQVAPPSSSSRARASTRSGVSKPSVNQP